MESSVEIGPNIDFSLIGLATAAATHFICILLFDLLNLNIHSLGVLGFWGFGV
jgi:hypothetical protein